MDGGRVGVVDVDTGSSEMTWPMLKFAKRIWNDPVWSKVIAVAVVAAIVAVYGWLSGNGAKLVGWMSETVMYSRWALPASFGLGAVVFAVIVWLRRKPIRSAFQVIIVGDKRLPIQWHIKCNPQGWIADHKIASHSAKYHEELLAGPYHAKSDCCSQLSSVWPSYHSAREGGPLLMPHCPGCRAIVFNIVEEDAYPHLWKVRTQAIEELQRLARIGRSIKTGTALENPGYWEYMLPHA
jgi:hypothetical protein